MSAGRPETIKKNSLIRSEYVLIFFIGLLYVVLIGRYRAYDLDCVWFLSFSHAFSNQHISTDPLMLETFPYGMGGVIAFGKIAAFIQGAILNIFGWTLAASTMISIVFVVAALVLIADMCRQLGYSSRFTLCFIALLGLSEPFVSTSQKTRYEFVPVFFLALALWLVARNFITMGTFVAAMAAEIEPAAVVIPLAVITVILIQGRRDRTVQQRIPRILLGSIAALGFYFLLHPNIISIFRSARWGKISNGTYPGGFVAEYYFHFKRHLLDLALLVAALVVAIRSKRHLLTEWPAFAILTILVASALLRWGNSVYFSFASPFLCLFIMRSLFSERYWKWIFAAILLATVPQYAYRYHYWSVRSAGFSQQDQLRVASAIDRASAQIGKSPAQVHILGNFNLWYAHPDHFVNLDRRIVTPAVFHDADMLLCFDKLLDPILAPANNFEIPCSSLNSFTKPIEQMTIRGHELQIRIPTTQN
jgi:hypothetical protein